MIKSLSDGFHVGSSGKFWLCACEVRVMHSAA